MTQAHVTVNGEETLDLRPMKQSLGVHNSFIPYRPRHVFLPYHQRLQRFSHVVAHRRCGKTVAAVNDDQKKVLTTPRAFPPPQVAFISPTYNMGKRNAWLYAKYYASPIPGISISEQDLTITYPNKGKYIFVGSDNYEAIRGTYFDHVTFDEYALQNPQVWTSVVRPALSDYKGSATFLGSAKGRNHFYDLLQKIKGDDKWLKLDLRASNTGLVDQEELDDAKRDMSIDEYLQEYENNFDAAVTGSYYGRIINDLEDRGRFVRLLKDESLDTFLCFDLGMGDGTAIWAIQICGNEWRVIKYIYEVGKDMPFFHNWIKKERLDPTEIFLPHDGDAREQISGISRKNYLEDQGYSVTVVPKHAVDDGIHACRMVLPRCYFDIDTYEGYDALKMYRKMYDPKKKIWLDKPHHDWASHGADAFRTGVMGLFNYKPSLKPKQVENFEYFDNNWMG